MGMRFEHSVKHTSGHNKRGRGRRYVISISIYPEVFGFLQAANSQDGIGPLWAREG